MKRLLLFLLLAATAFAGQSFVFNCTGGCSGAYQTLVNTSVPAQSGSWREDIYLDSEHMTLTTDPAYLQIASEGNTATGLLIEFSGSCAPNLCLSMYVQNEGGTITGNCNTVVGTAAPANFPPNLSVPGSVAVIIRYQHNATAKSDTCEVLDATGLEHYSTTTTYTTISGTTNGFGVVGTVDGQRLAFIRLCTGSASIVPVGSQMPTTAGGCNINGVSYGTYTLEWKFDGDLSDSSPNSYTASRSNGGALTYATTPIAYQSPIAVLAVLGHPFWSNFPALNAAGSNQMDGSLSFTEADESVSSPVPPAVAYLWGQTSSGSCGSAAFSSTSAAQPFLTGLTFGNCDLTLTVTDVNSNTATASTGRQLGATYFDSNGVINFGQITANAGSNLNCQLSASACATQMQQMFGELIAFGKNPWGLQDSLASIATTARSAVYDTFPGCSTNVGDCPAPPTWDAALTGTVSYPFVPIGGTTIDASGTGGTISPTTLTITVMDATKLDLSSFPTILMLNGLGGEEIRVCSHASNVLTVCYDGRGYRHGTQFGLGEGGTHAAAQSWSSGTTVTQQKVTGSGTHLMATFNPVATGGGWSGPAVAGVTNGTCSATAGSSTITTTSGNWSSYAPSAAYVIGYGIQISGTHSSTPFTFWAYVSTSGTTSPSGVSSSPSPQVVTPVSMAGIVNGALLTITNPGTGATEIVTAGSVTGSTFTATFVNSYPANFTIEGTALTTNRPYPSDADTASGLSCTIFKADYTNMVLHYARCGTGFPGSYPGCISEAYPIDGYTYFYTDGCESDTACYIYEGHDPSAVAPTLSTCAGFSTTIYTTTYDGLGTNLMACGVRIAYMNSFSYVGDNTGVNFYDEGLAHFPLYLRSGAGYALDAFRKVEGHDDSPFVNGTSSNGYMFYPELAQNDIGTQPRRASVLGMWAAYLFDGKNSNLSGLRSFTNTTIQKVANFSSGPGCNDDLREGILYPLHWLASSALWDPDSTSLGYPTQLANWYTAYGPCSNSSSSTPLIKYSWANGGLWNSNQGSTTGGGVGFTAINGSPILTTAVGNVANNALCGNSSYAASGTTATVTNNSDVVTGSGFIPQNTSSSTPANGGGKIMFEDATLGLLTFDYIYDSSTQVHLSGMYPGATVTGAMRWRIGTDSTYNGIGFDSTLVFATSSSDPELKEQWDCTWNSSTQITLDRPWDGPTVSSPPYVYGWRGNIGGVVVAGYGNEVFYVAGIGNIGLNIASNIGGSLGTNFATLAANTATWVQTYGYDPLTGGVYYGRSYPSGEPIYADSSQPQNFPEGFRNPQVSYNGWAATPTYSVQTARGLGGEGGSFLATLIAANPSAATFAKTFYANAWDVAPYTAAGYQSADHLGSENCGPNVNWSLGKWTGFCFGIGMSGQFPAALAGAGPPSTTPGSVIGAGTVLGPGVIREEIFDPFDLFGTYIYEYRF